ncbi:DUF1343 domain-containing protein [Neolewinella lacunae]|nr:DUF1343 domain-containing protein [Neolewinella lacunae]MDN3633918.1 DUF1343 domain-containing protein [Neolewinella lacunae]
MSDTVAPLPAAYFPESYLPLLTGQRLALVVNQTSTVANSHLVDTLLAMDQDVRRIFAPEHGFRGSADAGAQISDGRDSRSGLPIKSLYGKTKKPSAADLADIDVIVFDIQDVGARFYTYISTLYYVMEAAARYGKTVVVLDRPNPNGHLIDGPVLDTAFQSFVGIVPIPVAHGLTVGEFAQLVNGEGWLPEGLRVKLSVVKMPDYAHDRIYELPIPPSPNLPNQRSIYLYPSLCFFEGTPVSVGRGTSKQFQVYGHPALPFGDYYFTPTPGPGSQDPPLNGERCRGEDLTHLSLAQARGTGQLDLDRLINTYRALESAGVTFFSRPDFFDLLAGTDQLRLQILAGQSAAEIRASWQPGLAEYRVLRERYLLY